MTRVLGFDWDEGNLAKCRKHGVSVEEIEFILSNDPIVSPDMTHSLDEQRMIAVGRNAKGRPIFVAYTVRERGDLTFVRPVSARYMHSKEAERYESQTGGQSTRSHNG